MAAAPPAAPGKAKRPQYFAKGGQAKVPAPEPEYVGISEDQPPPAPAAPPPPPTEQQTGAALQQAGQYASTPYATTTQALTRENAPQYGLDPSKGYIDPHFGVQPVDTTPPATVGGVALTGAAREKILGEPPAKQEQPPAWAKTEPPKESAEQPPSWAKTEPLEKPPDWAKEQPPTQPVAAATREITPGAPAQPDRRPRPS